MANISFTLGRKYLSKAGLVRPVRGQRQYERHACCIPAYLHIAERDYDIEGLNLEVSAGGLLFRPAARYILERDGSEIAVRFLTYKLAGRIMNSRAAGYGVRLNSLLSADDLDSLVDEYGVSREG
jgi:hypothetical protein